MARKHDIRPERIDKFVAPPEGVIIEKPDGRKFKLEKGSDGQYKPVEIIENK